MTDQNDGDKLYAGKFKTVEELENGYKNSLPVFQEKEDLKKRLDEVTKVPDEYQVPSSIELHDNDIAEAKRLAKNSNLTQTQFEKLLNETTVKSKTKHESFENAKKELGADNLNILQDYVKNYYPEHLHDTILKKLIVDKTAREGALAHRAKLLDNKAPGMNRAAAGGYNVNRDDVIKAREEYMKRPHDMKARQKYLNLTSQLAQQKNG